jgi:hypothetical protein
MNRRHKVIAAGVGVPAIGVLAVGSLLVAGYFLNPGKTVEIRNDTKSAIELSCGGNDAPEVDASSTGPASMGVGRREQCLVYRLDGVVYLGCLTVDTTVVQASPVLVSSRSVSTPSTECGN